MRVTSLQVPSFLRNQTFFSRLPNIQQQRLTSGSFFLPGGSGLPIDRRVTAYDSIGGGEGILQNKKVTVLSLEVTIEITNGYVTYVTTFLLLTDLTSTEEDPAFEYKFVLGDENMYLRSDISQVNASNIPAFSDIVSFNQVLDFFFRIHVYSGPGEYLKFITQPTAEPLFGSSQEYEDNIRNNNRLRLFKSPKISARSFPSKAIPLNENYSPVGPLVFTDLSSVIGTFVVNRETFVSSGNGGSFAFRGILLQKTVTEITIGDLTTIEIDEDDVETEPSLKITKSDWMIYQRSSTLDEVGSIQISPYTNPEYGGGDRPPGGGGNNYVGFLIIVGLVLVAKFTT